MSVVSIHEAKTHLSRLIKACLDGEEVIIARRDEPVVRLVPLRPRSGRRRLGLHRGAIEMPPDFDAPLGDFEPYTPER